MPISPAQKEQLIAAAREVATRAYCPYSNFPVGAAILTEKGKVITGFNVENASYGLTICAERTAMTRALVEAAGRPLAVAVVGKLETPLTPCGACRQFLAEFNPDMTVICVGTAGAAWEGTIRDLLPLGFSPLDLERAAGGVHEA